MLKLSTFILSTMLLILNIAPYPTTGTEKNIAMSAEEVCPVTPGTEFPTAVVRTIEGESFSITESLANKPAVIIFYRGGWCPYCNLHLQELRTIEDELLDIGYNIFAVSPDTPEKISESIDTYNMQYTLLSDSELALGRALGIVFQEKEENVAWLRDRGMDIEDHSGRDHHLLPVPSVFIVDTEGIIRFSFIHHDYRIRLDSKILVTAAESLLESDWRLQ
jgi:peroxiredoxin